MQTVLVLVLCVLGANASFLKDKKISIAHQPFKPISLLPQGVFGENLDDSKEDFQKLTINAKCFFLQNFTVYDLSGLRKSINDDVRDYEVKINQKTFYFNFCEDVNSKTCKDIPDTQMVEKDGSKCTAIAKSSFSGSDWEVSYIEKDQERTNNTVRLTLGKVGDYNIQFIMRCDTTKDPKYKDADKFNYLSKTLNDKNITIEILTKESCPKINFYVVWYFLDKNKIIFGIILIAVGGYLAFLGKKFDFITIWIIVFVLTFIVVVIFMYQYILPGGTADWVIWVVVAVAVIIGGVLGYFCSKYKRKVFGLLLGIVTGYFIGQTVYNFAAKGITWQPTVVRVLIIVGAMIVMILISCFFMKFLTIFCTSFIGAYLFVRGISLFAGKFPNEFSVADLIKNGEFDQLGKVFGWQVYVYLASIILMALICIVIQYKINGEKSADTKEEDDVTNAKDAALVEAFTKGGRE